MPQDGKDVPVGSIGEVLLKTPSLPLGYWEDSEATKDLFSDGAWSVVFVGANVEKCGKTRGGNHRTVLEEGAVKKNRFIGFWSFAFGI